ncbi:metal-dependent phosphoesterase [Microbacterium mangrovi]|uniref:Metal-dependent phosphoesterase n=1 Tax=Microbacterium mangrovi TaxID=1348253 RepID=A0A0B2A4K3_9MICO|nr:PHP domain-containing protein [Microbacterium mangrovi]KHK98409.1 metal-dependent phosphoesterase [Microbacterium mangrovi]
MTPQRFRGPADLHLHSQNSDGTESPAVVMDAAHAHGIRTASLTDHDTTSGWAEAAGRARELGMTFIPGMEMSAKYGGRSVHVLSYLIDPEDADLGAMIARVRESREKRVSVMVERIGVDYDLTWADVVAKTTDGATVGRPHIADALIARGIVADRTEAFADILHPRSDYYVSLFAPDPLTAVSLVVGAGGVPIIAHPAGRAGLLPVDLLERLVEAGLAGFEVGHRENREPGLTRLGELVAAHDLIVTGSSDYHGAGKPNLPGENTTSDDMVQRIIDRATGSAPVYA